MEPPIEPPPHPPPPSSSVPPPRPETVSATAPVPVTESTISQVAVDNSQFLGSIMEESDKLDTTLAGVGVGDASVAEVTEPVKKRRGRPPKNGGAPKSGAAPKSAVEAKMGSSRKRKRDEEEEEVVCFICFDGGNLVVCDKRGCPKVYHPSCIHRDEAFFKTRGKWNCGWHICSMCQKNSQFMCYTCTYSSCRRCLKGAKFFRVRGSKGFCDTCFGTIVLIEDNNIEKKVAVDFDDKNSWEYLFKLYWVELKDNLSLTIEELKIAKERWDPNVVSTSKTDSTDDSYDANSDLDASSDGSSVRHKKGNRGKKRGRKSTKSSAPGSGRPAQKAQKTQKAQRAQDLTPSKEIEIKVMPFPDGTEWATPDMLDFVGHMRDGNRSYVSQYDVQALVLDYIKKNNLRDPRKKSQIICDPRLLRLFGKPRVAHFEMLKLIELHFLVKETSQAITNGGNNLNLGQVENGESGGVTPKSVSGRRRKRPKIPENSVNANIGDYAAIDMHNIGLVYLRRVLMEELLDDVEKFKENVVGAFVRIRIPGVVQKQDMYRLVKVVGTSKAGEKYKVGKKMTDLMLEIFNLDKKEVITADAISNQEFSEEECKRLRQSIKCCLMAPLKVGEVQEKARSLKFLRINELIEIEKQRLSHLRDRASETGRRKELRECVEKLQVLNTPEEKERRLHEVPIVHSDPQMDPAYKSGDVPTAEMHKPDGGRNKGGSRRRGREAKDPSGSTSAKQSKNNGEIGTGSNSGPQFGVPPEAAASSEAAGGEKVWHYRDPTGNIQGPFSLQQLGKWSSYFPPALKVWLMIDSEDNSLLLTDILPKNLKVSAETNPTNSVTVPGGSSANANASNAGSSTANSSKLSSNNQAQAQVCTSSAGANVHDSGKAAQANNISNSIKEYGSIWSPTKSNLGSSSQQSRNNLKDKTVVPSVSVPAPAPSSVTAHGSQNSSAPASSAEKTELKSSPSPSTASVPAPESGPNTNKVEETVKPKVDEKQVDQVVTSLNNADSIAPSTAPTSTPTPAPAANPISTPTPTPTCTHTPPPTSTSTAPVTATITAATTTTAPTLVDHDSPEKEKNQQSENEYPSPTPPNSDRPVAEPDDAPDESWPEVQVHESTGVETWVHDPTTTSLDTGTSYPSDCLSPADILLSLSRVADEDLEDGDFIARMEALKKKSRLSDREERPMVGHGVLDLSVTPVDGAALQETAECSLERKSALAVQKETKPTTTGGEVLFLQTDPMRTNSWDKLGDPIGADWSLPSPTPLATKTSGLGVDGISTSGHVGESIFMSGAHQRAVATNPESSVVMARTTYMDLNTTLQGSIGTGDMAPSSVNAGVTWSNATLKGGIDTTDVSTGISWNVGAVDTSHAASASPNTGITRSSITMHGNMSPKSTQANTGVTWSTLSGSVTSPPSSQSKPKPYNSWAEAIHANSNNIGWAANVRSGWGPPAPAPAPAPTPVTPTPQHVHLNPNPSTIPEARKEVATDPNASWGTTLALGNTTQSNWEAGGGGVDWASQWNRSSWHGGGSQSRPQPQPSRGQVYQRGICKFYESGYCKKGASCNYMHP